MESHLRVSPMEHVADPHTRQPWVAAVLTLFITGIGHVYAGRPYRGVILWLLSLIASYLWVLAAARVAPLGVVVGCEAIALGFWTWTIADAFRTARRAPTPYPIRKYNRWYGYTSIVVTWLIVISTVRNLATRYVGRPFSQPGPSMSPTIEIGDWLIAAPSRGEVPRGAVVVYHSAYGPLVKRVVGVPGDTLTMRAGHLLLGAAPLAEPYARSDSVDRTDPDFAWQRGFVSGQVDRSTYRPSLNNWGPIVVPAGDYFVLGDNRGDSMDSRYTGFIARDSIFARPTFIYFSWDADEHRVRWSRLWHLAEGR